MCDISVPIGVFDIGGRPDLIPVSRVVEVGTPTDVRTDVTASVAVKIESFSFVVAAYTFTAGSSVGIVRFKTFCTLVILIQFLPIVSYDF